MRPQDLDTLWTDIVLGIIGEGLGSEGTCVCGAVVSARNKVSKIALWISDRSEEKAVPVGKAFHQILKDGGFKGDISFEDFSSESKAPAFTLQGNRPEGNSKGNGKDTR